MRLCRARSLLREVHDRPVSIGEAAREAALSPYHFIRVFRAVFGQTPHQLRIDARLERARSLLMTRDYTVTEVCAEVGFASLGTFSTLFAQRVGLPPSQWRRQVRALVQVPGTVPAQLVPGCLTLMWSLPRW